MNIFVGNLNYRSTDDSLRAAFEAYGEVESAKVITSRDSGRSRGFGFVEMPNEDEAKAAIAGLDSKDLDGRDIRVNEARSKTEGGDRPPREKGGDRPPRQEGW